MHQVVFVEERSLAARHGIVPGDLILSINGEPLIDDIDYQALTAKKRVKLEVIKQDGSKAVITIVKPVSAPLGVQFAQTIVCDPRTCNNNCVFCFVDQMPEGMRDTLYVKDDDWRLSLMMGNFVTLTNVGEWEFDRILRRRVSPLYVSIHATDPQVRVAMMRQQRAADLMPRLQRLQAAGLSFHGQVVLCPGLNDGAVLERTLKDIYAMRPSALSIALVPVGLTKYREGLAALRPFTKPEAQAVLDICERYQQMSLHEHGDRFVYPADELICIANADLPSDDSYDGYPQIENGIGMIRLFEEELSDALSTAHHTSNDEPESRVIVACGTSIEPYMRDWVNRSAPLHVKATVQAVKNDFFGHTVTVSGLITGQDLARQLYGKAADMLLLPQNMLNSDQSMFLDNMTINELEAILGFPVRIIPSKGDQLVAALRSPRALLAG